MDVYTRKRGALTLKEPPLGTGGEGAVYEILGYPEKVAKIYHDAYEAKRRESKIIEMVDLRESGRLKSVDLSRDIAWPLSPLFDQEGYFLGFGMDRISGGTELDDLYAYPPHSESDATIKDKIRCLISLFEVVERVHQAGQVFGDLNPNNIKINPDWSVSFVDADSYHIKKGEGEYRCVVCAPGYVAPEVIRAVKGGTYADCAATTFTNDSDNFALAIHVFRMLMHGAHPFICERKFKQQGSAPAPKPMDKRVERGETPFFKTISNYTVPHFAPEISSMPSYLRDLFRRAFIDGAMNPSARPHAMEWKSALRQYQGDLVACTANRIHHYWKENSSCPYCEADQRHTRKMGPSSSVASQLASVHGSSVSVATHAASGTGSSIKGGASQSFWVITLVMTILMQTFLGYKFFPGVYAEVLVNETLVWIGIIGSSIAAIFGASRYNTKWSPGRGTGHHAWWEYLLSVLVAVGYSIGFVVVMGLVVIVLYIVWYAFIGILLVGGFIAVLSGE